MTTQLVTTRGPDDAAAALTDGVDDAFRVDDCEEKSRTTMMQDHLQAGTALHFFFFCFFCVYVCVDTPLMADPVLWR